MADKNLTGYNSARNVYISKTVNRKLKLRLNMDGKTEEGYNYC